MCTGDERPQESRKCLAERNMSLHSRMHPVNRQVPVQRAPQVPHVYADTRVVRSDLLRYLGERVYDGGWRLHVHVWGKVLRNSKESGEFSKLERSDKRNAR